MQNLLMCKAFQYTNFGSLILGACCNTLRIPLYEHYNLRTTETKFNVFLARFLFRAFFWHQKPFIIYASNAFI